MARSIVDVLAPYDVVVTPALARRPVPIGEIDGLGPDPMVNYRRSATFTPFTAIVNVTGQPAIALPLYHGEDGLPTAVQLIGPPAREEVLLALATQLERALPWAGRVPALSARSVPPRRRSARRHGIGDGRAARDRDVTSRDRDVVVALPRVGRVEQPLVGGSDRAHVSERDPVGRSR